MCCFTEEFASKVHSRSLIFNLCEDNVGSLAGFVACMGHKVVPLLLSCSMEDDLLSQLMERYQPAYLWVPIRYANKFAFPIILSKFDYVLMQTGNKIYPLYEELALLMTTSGSTGSPKLVRHSYQNIEANARNVAYFFGWTPDERGILALPMQYTMGLSVICSHLYVGAMILLTEHNLMSPEFWKFIIHNKGSNFTGVPFSYEILMKLRFTKMDLPHLKTIAEGGGKLSDKMFFDLAKYAEQTGRRFFATFGTTETTARLAYLPAELALQKCGSIGRAIPSGELFLLDTNGAEILEIVAEGEMGYRGPNVALGYAQCKEDLQKRDEWCGEYLTGDIARRDADGCYYIIGRKKRFLKLFGLRVSLDRCEQLICERFNLDVACTGTDKKMYIYITDILQSENVRFFISEKTGIHISAFSVKTCEIIPRNKAGKILYSQLE